MSEFTNGILFLDKDKEPVTAGFAESGLEHVVRSLNSKWSVVLLTDGWLSDPDSAEVLERISLSAPLLFFWNAEDHGWGYRVFHQGEVKAGLDATYFAAFSAALDQFGEEYPDEEPFDDEGNHHPQLEALTSTIETSAEFAEQLREQYGQVNPESLAVFGLSPETVEQLTAVLSASFAAEHQVWDQVNEFKRLLGIEEMSWVSYDYEDS